MPVSVVASGFIFCKALINSEDKSSCSHSTIVDHLPSSVWRESFSTLSNSCSLERAGRAFVPNLPRARAAAACRFGELSFKAAINAGTAMSDRPRISPSAVAELIRVHSSIQDFDLLAGAELVNLVARSGTAWCADGPTLPNISATFGSLDQEIRGSLNMLTNPGTALEAEGPNSWNARAASYTLSETLVWRIVTKFCFAMSLKNLSFRSDSLAAMYCKSKGIEFVPAAHKALVAATSPGSELNVGL